MRIDLLSLFPEFVAQVAGHGVVGRAQERGLLSIHGWNPRDYAEGNYRRVDDRPFGGGPGMVMMIEPLRAALAAVLPGALNDAESAAQDSFEGEGGLLDCPHYTRPLEHPFGTVPPVLLSGNHAEIAKWRRKQSLGRTWLRRPELIVRERLSRKDRALLDAFLAEQPSLESGLAPTPDDPVGQG
jgi:tRNA G37 N-methylase TrmD